MIFFHRSVHRWFVIGVSVCPTEQVESEEKTVKKRFLPASFFFWLNFSSSFTHSFECCLDRDRPSLRRQSARLKAAEVKPAEDLVETNKSRVCTSQLPEDTVCEQSSVSESALVKNEGSTDGSEPGYESQQFGGSTVYRPSRAAAKKVQSYKETSIKVKLRRPE